MNTYYLKPSQRIAEYVESILIIESDFVSSSFSLPLFANGTPTLVFSSSPGKVGEVVSYLTLFGQTVRPAAMVIDGSFRLFAWFLVPSALGALFNVSAAELTNQPIALEALENTAPLLVDRLLNAPSSNEVLRLIDNFIHSKATGKLPVNDPIKYAADRISVSSDKDILKTVREELYLSERTFQRTFERRIGITPGQFRRICQFRRAFRQMNAGNDIELLSVAYHNNYADQSHFIRAFKEFTALTPSQYLSLARNV